MAVAASTLAATGDYVPLVKIPNVDTGNFLNYLRDIYNFLISIVGILAMASLVYGGFRYLTSVGNPAAVEDAKDIINSAVIGLVLALSSWLILNEINPDVLVTSKKPGITGQTWPGYNYNQTSLAKCFTNIDDPGYGTEANPCQCLDGTPQYSTKTRTNLTLSLSPTNPPPSAPAGSITASGKLIDDKGNGISGKTITINRVNTALDASNTFTTTTATDGSFTITSPVPCSDTATRQAVFDGDTTYTFAVSNPVTLTIGGTPTCVADSYMNKPADVSILPVGFCQNLCSDTTGNFAADRKFHCVSGKVGVGITAEQAASGNQTLSIKYSTPVYVDVVSNIKSPFGIGKVEFYHVIDWKTDILKWILGPSNVCVFDSACGALGCTTGFGEKQLDPPQPGKFITGYAGGSYIAGADIYVKNPATGLCGTTPTITCL